MTQRQAGYHLSQPLRTSMSACWRWGSPTVSNLHALATCMHTCTHAHGFTDSSSLTWCDMALHMWAELSDSLPHVSTT